MAQRRNQKVLKMKRKNSYTLGIILFLFSLFIAILFFQSITKEHVSIYEVTQKQIADNEKLRGIILRKEKLVTTDQTGYIDYFVGEGSKLAAKTAVYSVNKDASVAETASAIDTNNVKLTEEDTRNMRSTISDFRESFSLSSYDSITNFKYNVENTLLELSNIDLSDNLNKIKKQSGLGTNYTLQRAEATGLISFCTDGLENLSLNKIKASHFADMTEHWTQLRSSQKVQKGKPVYRVVTSENWSLVVKLTQAQYEKLSSKKSVSVTIKKDNVSLTPTITTFSVDGVYYANLAFNKYMVHYLNNRYLDIEIHFNNAKGLKIPVSSITRKKCYVIPKEYLLSNENGKQQGVGLITYDKSGGQHIEFVPAEVYYKDEDDNIYIDAKLLEAGKTIADDLKKPTKKMEVTTIDSLDGVYNCNQGYCHFRYVKKLYENEEYAIVEMGNPYSIFNYDHIIYDHTLINDSDIIY